MDVSPEHLLVLDVDDRGAHVTRDHLLGMIEEMRVVRGAVRVGDDRRDRSAAAACATGTLLVVRNLRGHVAKRDARERTDIDADLHRRRAAQHVDRWKVVERHVLEAQLVLLDLVEGVSSRCPVSCAECSAAKRPNGSNARSSKARCT